jgi:hypothetical protein
LRLILFIATSSEPERFQDDHRRTCHPALAGWPWQKSFNLTKIDRSHKRQKGNGSGLLDCMGERSLMLGTTTGQSSGNDFAAFGNEIS